MNNTTIAYDAMGSNAATLPSGQHCGYTTGSGGVAWIMRQWIADPLAVRIDQSPVNTALDETACVLDLEGGAATIADLVQWVTSARANFAAGARPGQHWPMVYCSGNSLTPVANTLAAAKIVNVPIWLADPGLSVAEAVAKINTASGPYPLWGIQNAWFNTYDSDVFLTAWLANMSGKAGNTIQVGNGGPAVVAAQQRLNTWKATPAALAVDGAFGNGTLAAVEAFQTAHKLVTDGIVGPITWAALDNNPVSVPAPPPVTGWQYQQVATLNQVRSAVDVAVSWTPPKGATVSDPQAYHAPTGYKVILFAAGLPPDKIVRQFDNVQGTSVTFAGLVPGKDYVVQVWPLGSPEASAAFRNYSFKA